MVDVPSLFSLCIKATKNELLIGEEVPDDVYHLPSELFKALALQLPPLALDKLQRHLPATCDSYDEYWSENTACRRKRKRVGIFDSAWRSLFHVRWPELGDQIETVSWLQIYWETHLQKCLDEAAAVALLPFFPRSIGEVEIPDSILKFIGYERHMNSSNQCYEKLSYHCQQFGYHAKSLSLQGVLCVEEMHQLLRESKLQSLVLTWVRFEEQVEGLCKLLSGNCETLTSIEFIHCKLSSKSINAICDALHKKGEETHGIKHVSLNASYFDETNPDSLPVGLTHFLSSGRCLCSFKLCENQVGGNFAKNVLRTILDSSSGPSTLDLSENNISGWLSDFNWRSLQSISSFSRVGNSLQSLRVLNIRGNNLQKDDADNLRYALVHIPLLEVLDLSDNPIEDDGVRNLIPYFIEASERCSRIADLNLENCDLSCDGVTELINAFLTIKRPLRFLSVADNSLGSKVAEALGKFLETSIQVLNISGIGLGSFGFQELQSIMGSSKITEIDISKNRGGHETANYLSKLLIHASEMVAVNASYNLMPPESLNIIYSALKVTEGSLKLLDLRGNHQLVDTSLFDEFVSNGMKILIPSSSPALDVPHDDDP